jgi:3-hydroxyacyl-CoA dehydrogenase
MSTCTVERRGGVAILTFGSPPVNSLGFETRRDLASAFDSLVNDSAVKAFVLIGRGGSFSAGADIRELGNQDFMKPPVLWHVLDMLDASPKPVVAAIEGVALGGGLELALACHYRVALQAAKLGLPEVKIGLLPGGGGTQRLTRLIGTEAALNVIVGGDALPAKMFAGSALLDACVASDCLTAAVTLAETSASELAKGGKLPRARDRNLNEPNREALLQFARTTVKAKFAAFPAPRNCIDAIAAAGGTDFEAGLAAERQLFSELLVGPESRALRHAFFAERDAAKIPDVPASTPTRNIASVAVIGGGTMGSGIAITALNADLPTFMLEMNQEALDRGAARVREFYEGQVKKGRLTAEAAKAKGARLTPTINYSDIANADIVIEAVFEEMSVKQQVFNKLDAVMKPGAILASNTSTLDLNAIAAHTKRPADVIGTHFFSPANVMKLLEVVRGKVTAPDVLMTVMKLARTLRKTAVVSGVCDGFIGNRMIEQYSRQAFFMLDEGASVQQIDGAIEKFGFAMGPFRMSDLAGNDIGWHIRKRRAVERPDVIYSTVADKLCELGRFGQKTSAGWYDYKPGDRSAYGSPVVEALVAQHRKDLALRPRALDDREIVDRLVFSLVNEAAQILDEGIAQRASDIDMVYLTGYGFPLWRGGPMRYAEEYGLFGVVLRMHEFARNPWGDPEFWTPVPLLARAAASGSFNDAQGDRS